MSLDETQCIKLDTEQASTVPEEDDSIEPSGIPATNDLMSGVVEHDGGAGTPSANSDKLEALPASESQSPLNTPVNEEEQSEWRPRGRGNKPASGKGNKPSSGKGNKPASESGTKSTTKPSAKPNPKPPVKPEPKPASDDSNTHPTGK